ncbi:MAG: hypothetical protein ACXVI3_05555 [Halobacteriota archaeon]
MEQYMTMRALLVVLILLLLVSSSLGCLNKAQDNTPVTTPAASTVLRFSDLPSVNQSEYAAFTCQLNVTRGSGLDGKQIHWYIDNTQKDPSFTLWGYASLNLSTEETRALSIGKHVMKASFEGDSDYSASNATAVFQVKAAPSPTPSPSASPSPSAEPEPRSITLSVPSKVNSGCIDVSGTHSGLKANENIYIFVKPQGNDTWKVQSLPFVYLSGTFKDNICFDKSGSGETQYEVRALITGARFDAGDTFTKLPSSAADTSSTVTVT